MQSHDWQRHQSVVIRDACIGLYCATLAIAVPAMQCAVHVAICMHDHSNLCNNHVVLTHHRTSVPGVQGDHPCSHPAHHHCCLSSSPDP
jgi:hypothetical protein